MRKISYTRPGRYVIGELGLDLAGESDRVWNAVKAVYAGMCEPGAGDDHNVRVEYEPGRLLVEVTDTDRYGADT